MILEFPDVNISDVIPKWIEIQVPAGLQKSAVQWRMTKPGEPMAQHYLYGRAKPAKTAQANTRYRLVHFAPGMNPNPYADLAPLIKQFAGSAPPPGTNWGKYLTQLGLSLNAGESPLTAIYNTTTQENVYTWKSMKDTPYRTISEQSIMEHPAAWWSHPQFEEVLDDKSGGVAGHPAGNAEADDEALWQHLLESANTDWLDAISDQVLSALNAL